MKRILTATGIIVLVSFFIASCGGGAKDKKGDVGDMKVKLEKLKKEKTKLDADIHKLEDEIAKADPKSAALKLVTVAAVDTANFNHYIELQGKIGSDGVAYVSPTGPGGRVTAIKVVTGQKVSKGQVVVKLDDAIERQGVIAAQQQTGQLKARLAQAQTVYERYDNLWKQNIGAEIQVINAKADVDALSAQLRAAEATVAQAQEAVNMTNVRAGISGTVEQVNVRVGEFFTGAAPGGGAQILIVNSTSIKVEIPVPDNYVSKIKKGDKVLVEVPGTGKPAFETTLSMVGGAINPTTRSFMAEAKLPSDPLLKPNQNATIKILDYQAVGAIAIDVNVVQPDEKGKYVYIAETTGDKTVARKRVVTVGESYNGLIEIKSGLRPGDMIITAGYQSVYDGQAISTGNKK